MKDLYSRVEIILIKGILLRSIFLGDIILMVLCFLGIVVYI